MTFSRDSFMLETSKSRHPCGSPANATLQFGARTFTRRRLFTLGAAAIMMPIQGWAQPRSGLARVGFLSLGSRPAASAVTPDIGNFLRGMRELGYVEGKNLIIEWRFADRDVTRLPSLAFELVQLKVDVIATAGSDSIRALQQATSTIPIVFAATGDPVGSGFVSSLARPGGNITGVSTLTVELSGKLLELLKIISPSLSRIAVLQNSSSSTAPALTRSYQDAARSIGAQIVVFDVSTAAQVAPAFTAIKQRRVDALVVSTPIGWEEIAATAAKQRLMSISYSPSFSAAGGLISYGVNLGELYLRAASYVDKILKGAKPADLPVEQPTKFDLVINMKTVKALGIVMPQEMLIRATRLIE